MAEFKIQNSNHLQNSLGNSNWETKVWLAILIVQQLHIYKCNANKTHSATRTYDVSVRHVTIIKQNNNNNKGYKILDYFFLTAPYGDFSVPCWKVNI